MTRSYSPGGRPGHLDRQRQPEQLGVLTSQVRGLGETFDAVTCRSGRSSRSASAIAPEPVPTSCTRALGEVERGLHEQLASGRGTSTRGSIFSSMLRKPFRPRMYATGSRSLRRRTCSAITRAAAVGSPCPGRGTARGPHPVRRRAAPRPAADSCSQPPRARWSQRRGRPGAVNCQPARGLEHPALLRLERRGELV